jgi:hypothetical protein
MRTAAEASIPPIALVEVGDQHEQPIGRGVDVRRQLRNLLSQSIDLFTPIFTRNQSQGHSPTSSGGIYRYPSARPQ